MDELLYALLAAFIVSLISFVGVLTLSFHIREQRRTLLMFVSFGAGAMLAAAFFDLLPESIEKTGVACLPFVLMGMVLFFVVEKMLFWHHFHEFHHLDEKGHTHKGRKPCIQPVGYLNIVGDAIHNFLDGVALAAAFLVSVPLGVITTIAIIVHEIPQEIADFGVLIHAGFTTKRALWFNFFSALTALLGVLVAYGLQSWVENLESIFLPIAAGGFLYIAATDLMPELKHEENPWQSALQFIPFALGILMIWGLSQAIGA